MEDTAREERQRHEELGRPVVADGLGGLRVLEEDPELPVLEEPEVTRHDWARSACPRERRDVLVTPAELEHTGDGAAGIDFPRALGGPHGGLGDVEPIGSREDGVLPVSKLERLSELQGSQRHDGGTPHGSDTEDGGGLNRSSSSGHRSIDYPCLINLGKGQTQPFARLQVRANHSQKRKSQRGSSGKSELDA